MWNGGEADDIGFQGEGGGQDGGKEVASHLMLLRGVTNEFLWWPLHASEGLWNTSSDIIRLVLCRI
jgi:hypothetical protein